MKRLREIREAFGWNATDLAPRLGLSVPALMKLESDEAYPSLAVLRAMAFVIGGSVPNLIMFNEGLSVLRTVVVDPDNEAIEAIALAPWGYLVLKHSEDYQAYPVAYEAVVRITEAVEHQDRRISIEALSDHVLTMNLERCGDFVLVEDIELTGNIELDGQEVTCHKAICPELAMIQNTLNGFDDCRGHMNLPLMKNAISRFEPDLSEGFSGYVLNEILAHVASNGARFMKSATEVYDPAGRCVRMIDQVDPRSTFDAINQLMQGDPTHVKLCSGDNYRQHFFQVRNLGVLVTPQSDLSLLITAETLPAYIKAMQERAEGKRQEEAEAYKAGVQFTDMMESLDEMINGSNSNRRPRQNPSN